jgi:hypothetical protein
MTDRIDDGRSPWENWNFSAHCTPAGSARAPAATRRHSVPGSPRGAVHLHHEPRRQGRAAESGSHPAGHLPVVLPRRQDRRARPQRRRQIDAAAIMAGIDTEIDGEARPQPGIKIGYLPQEPQLDPDKDVRGNVEEGLADHRVPWRDLEKVYAAYAEPDADFDALAKEQGELEDIIQATDGHNLERNPAGGGRRRPAPAALGRGRDQAVRRRAPPRGPVPPAAVQARTCCCSTSRPTTWTPSPSPGWSASCTTTRHRRRGHPRPLLPRQRRRLDPRTRPRPRHPLRGQLLRPGWSRRRKRLEQEERRSRPASRP